MRDERTLTSGMTLVDVLRLRPGSAAVFDEVGIDYACGGATSVKQAAANAGLTAKELLALLELRPASPSQKNWSEAPLAELTRFLVRDHVRIVTGLLPRVRAAIDAAAEVYGELAELRRLRELDHVLMGMVTIHATAEEQELFPIVNALEAAASSPDIRAPKARISARVLGEVIEHETIRDRVHAMRDLVHDLLDAHDVQVLSSRLRDFQRQLHEHMHLENNVLYPRAIAIENRLRHAQDGEHAAPA